MTTSSAVGDGGLVGVARLQFSVTRDATRAASFCFQLYIFFSFTDLNTKKRSVSGTGIEETKCGYNHRDTYIFGGSHASGNIAVMGISICKSCKNVACIWIVILFILCDFFSCILGIDYQKWTNFGFEITRFIKTIILSLQDPPIFDMYERKCIYIYRYI